MAKAIIMGVAGSGKSSIGSLLAERLPAVYIDGDDLHPRTNIEKMSRGQPLNDADRKPWLIEVGKKLGGTHGPALIGCSALKRSYRDTIRNSAGDHVVFIHLAGTRAVIEARMQNRAGHFMPSSLIDSQFADLEQLDGDEVGFAVDIDQRPDAIVSDIIENLKGIAEWDMISP